jgi:hypothetical protein
MMMTDARGKLGGQVFSKNRSGAYVRTKVTPVNPRTVAQMQSRSILGSLSVLWNGITDVQRASWNEAVGNWQKTDIFGDLKKPTGKNLFVSLNKNLLQSGQAEVLTAPEKMDLPSLADLQVTFVDTAGTLSILGAPGEAGITYQVSATPKLPNGASYFKNQLRVLHYTPTPGSDSVDILDAYEAKFGEISDGDNIFWQIRAIGENGQAGVPMTVRTEYA